MFDFRLCFLIDGLSCCKAAKEFEVPKSSFRDKINQGHTNGNIGWKNVLFNEIKLALKEHIDYMQFTNHPLWKGAVKASAWTLVK